MQVGIGVLLIVGRWRGGGLIVVGRGHGDGCSLERVDCLRWWVGLHDDPWKISSASLPNARMSCPLHLLLKAAEASFQQRRPKTAHFASRYAHSLNGMFFFAA